MKQLHSIEISAVQMAIYWSAPCSGLTNDRREGSLQSKTATDYTGPRSRDTPGFFIQCKRKRGPISTQKNKRAAPRMEFFLQDEKSGIVKGSDSTIGLEERHSKPTSRAFYYTLSFRLRTGDRHSPESVARYAVLLQLTRRTLDIVNGQCYNLNMEVQENW